MTAPVNMMRLAFLAAVVLLLISGCGKSPQEKLLGTWQEIDGQQNIVEFFEDGSFRLRLKKGELGSMESLNGKWLILKDGRIKIDVSVLGMAESQVAKLHFEGNEMIMTDDTSGKATRHKRLK
jgi:hypothetical protein